MERIDDLMERLKGQMPQVPDADALTDSIMAAIDTPRRIPMWLTALRTVSSVAAVVLMLLFVHLESKAAGTDDANADYLGVASSSFECEECSPAENYYLHIEKMRIMNERKIIKKKIYASFDF
ncbi:MAG: hypothetical protein IKJ66_08095 [Bacteroidaceae bacterium]|jgi:hypothetical protein|nr:hypothetical protein [Bacteroidaceae bacterium]